MHVIIFEGVAGLAATFGASQALAAVPETLAEGDPCCWLCRHVDLSVPRLAVVAANAKVRRRRLILPPLVLCKLPAAFLYMLYTKGDAGRIPIPPPPLLSTVLRPTVGARVQRGVGHIERSGRRSADTYGYSLLVLFR